MRHKVKFQPSGAVGQAGENESLLDAARGAGEQLYAACGGQGVCGKCRVGLAGGELAPASDAEHRLLSPDELAGGTRLACQASPRSDVAVLVPEESSGIRTVTLGMDGSRVFTVDPAVRNLYVELEPPSESDPSSDARRLLSGLYAAYGVNGLEFGLGALRGLHGALAGGGWKLTACLRDGRDVVRIEPGYAPIICGAAFDVGTTTIAATLCDLSTGVTLASEARTNPLVVMGDDVLSRVSYAAAHDGGLEGMRSLLMDSLNDMLEVMADRAGDGVTAADVMEAVLVGNTVMHHILLGLPLGALGVHPFTPALTGAIEASPAETGLGISPAGRVYAPPLIGGFIGSDITAGLIALGPFGDGAATLVADIGTNGELVLFHGGRITAASCATGPALEGAQISCGMRAAPGAIERALVDPDSGEVSYRLVGAQGWSKPGAYSGARGICGSGTVDLVAQMRRAGVIDETGAIDASAPGGRVQRSGSGETEFVVALQSETKSGRAITVTQSDVRAVQLAKAALAAGIGILMAHAGISEIGRLVVAGAFGNYLDIYGASAIGMFPGCSPESAYQAGNAAGDGARALLLSAEKRREAASLARRVSVLELSGRPDFQDAFLIGMALP